MKNFFRHYFSGITKKLIVINVAVFFVVFTTDFFLRLSGSEIQSLTRYIALEGNFSSLLRQPWTIFTYGFYHAQFLHLFFNMLMLYFFGQFYHTFLSERSLLWLYLTGILVGGGCFMIYGTVFSHPSSLLVGSSAGIFALMMAVTVYLPDYRVRFWGVIRMKLWVVTLVVTVIGLFNFLSTENIGGGIAHLGGFLTGAFYGIYYRGKIRSEFGIRVWYISLFKKKRKKNKSTVVANESDSDMDKSFNERRIDAILDKISASGYASLSRQDKDFLYRISRQGRSSDEN